MDCLDCFLHLEMQLVAVRSQGCQGLFRQSHEIPAAATVIWLPPLGEFLSVDTCLAAHRSTRHEAARSASPEASALASAETSALASALASTAVLAVARCWLLGCEPLLGLLALPKVETAAEGKASPLEAWPGAEARISIVLVPSAPAQASPEASPLVVVEPSPLVAAEASPQASTQAWTEASPQSWASALVSHAASAGIFAGAA